MSITSSSTSNMLNDIHSTIERRTHGRLTHLSLDIVDGAFVIEAVAGTYHAVQLALAAVHAFTAESPHMAPARMSFRVNGHSLELRNGDANEAKERATDRDGSNDNGLSSSSSLVPNVVTIAVE